LPEPDVIERMTELDAHVTDLDARTAQLGDDLRNGLRELRTELRDELTHLGRTVRADSTRLRRELGFELTGAVQSIVDRLDGARARSTALLIAGPLFVTVTLCTVLLRLS
jgi:hypothetical protein